MNQTLKVHLALTTVAVLYSANYSAVKAVTPAYLSPFALVGLRVIGGALLFSLVQGFAGRRVTIARQDYPALLACGLSGIAANQLLFIKGLSMTNPINASLLITTTPILVFVISAIVLKERITFIQALGLLLGALGTVLLLAGKDFSFNSRTLAGDLILLVSTIFFGAYLIMVKPLSKKYPALTITQWAFLFGLLPVLPFSWGDMAQVTWSTLPLVAWLNLAFVILGATFLAYLLNNWTLQYVSPSVVGIYIYLQPLLASLLAVGIGKDQLTLDKVLLGGMILSGVYLVGRK